jgi:ATP-binding cassette subfamily B protein
MQRQRERGLGQFSWSIFRRMMGYILPYWELRAIMVLIVFTTVLSVLSPAIIGDIVDMVESIASGEEIRVGGGVEDLAYVVLLPISRWLAGLGAMGLDYGMLLVFSFSLIVIAALDGVLTYAERYISTVVSQKASFDMRNAMYNSLLDQSFSFYDQQRTGQLMARATGDINMLERFFDMGLRQGISTVLLVVMIFYSIVTLNWELTLLSMIVIPLIFAATLIYSRMVSPMWREVRDQLGVITSVLQENLTGIRVVRGFSREDYEEHKFSAECHKYFDINIVMAKISSFFMPLATLISSIGLVAVLWYGGNQVIAGAMSIGSIVAFYLYLTRLMQPVRMLGFITSMFVRSNAAAERVFEIVDAKVDVHDKEGASELKTVEGRVTFKDAWFSYDGKNMVLKDIDLDIQPGQTVAILGATGSGKSSIINLIPRFYDVTRGSIKVDGVDIRDVTIKSLRKHIGIVRQDPFIFSTTLRGNISYGVEDATLDKIKEAAAQAKIDEFIAGRDDEPLDRPHL